MANRTKVLETLKDYFNEKGRVLSVQEYSREIDTPVRLQQIRNIFGSWNRMEKLLMARNERYADDITDVDDVIRARNEAAWAAQQQWREASENQDAKALREATAVHVAEVLAINAATPEGANANKIAIGGPLPSEQPDYSKLGATVKTDPVTKEQTVVDVQPELVVTTNDDPRTPAELKEFVKATTGDIPVGHATDGGSQGTASIATVSALDAGGEDEEVKPVVDTKKAADAKKA